MKRVGIIGVGLIGGSLGMALKKTGKYYVVGIGRNKTKLKLAIKLNAIDEYTTDLKSGVQKVDIVVMAVPVDAIVPIYNRIRPYLNGKVITDVGSVKWELVKNIKDPNFVPAHPLAGSEKSGVKFARADLFRGANIVITPTKSTSQKAIKDVKEMWRDVGAKIKFMSAKKHDRIVSYTSHLPHVISATFVDLVHLLGRDARDMLAGSFRDMTRITDSSPELWSDISHTNRNELSKAIDNFVKKLLEFKSNLGNKRKLYSWFLRSKTNRKLLLR